MRKYKCSVCGYIHEAAGDLPDGFACPLCTAPKAMFKLIEEAAPVLAAPQAETKTVAVEPVSGIERTDSGIRYMAEIHQMAASGESIIEAMGIQNSVPSWDDILILGAQLDRMPLERHEAVDTQTIIGRRASKPMVLENPVYISHMSFGALSREAKTALAKGSAMAKAAMCSGEGGILPEERAAAHKYIFEYVPNLYSVTPENLRSADAIEIKIGQGTKPWLGGHLPGEKVTEEIAAVRGKPAGVDIHSPSKFSGINSRDDLKRLVEKLRDESGGRPVGIKIGAGQIERDLTVCVYAGPDFITIDGRGGATGASPKLVRDSTSVPTIYALHRAREYLDSVGSDISLVITGGLRVSSDFAKAIAMGADAVAVATAGLLALGCRQYRICGTGKCPAGIATQDPALRSRLDMDTAAQRVANFLIVSLGELKNFARLTGHKRLRDLSVDDLCTINQDIANYTDIAHASDSNPTKKISEGDAPMSNLKGTKTEANLMEAFAGESQARNKYTYFASRAKKDGYEQIAAIFEETAGNEKEHAKLWFKLLCGGAVPGTAENLKAAAAGEHEEWTAMYKRMADEAREEGFQDIAFLFDAVGAIEKEHEERYLKLLQNIGDGSVFAKKEKSVWICRNCGHIVDSENAPEMCPVCKHPQAYFELRAVNY